MIKKQWLVYILFQKSFYVRHFVGLTDDGIRDVLAILNAEIPWNAEIWFKEKGTDKYKFFFR